MNRLAQETSPYLRQHRNNPVAWYAWGPEAFADAAARNVPVLLSVGYSACHWCHVMAHECFEDVAVAARMNELFVNVKVDREERPDVDSIYMDAVQAMSGRGGWPMTVFMTPTGEPFYGGTYFPKVQFMQLMAAIDDVWRTRPDDIKQNITALTESLRRTALVTPLADVPGFDLVELGLEQLAANFDSRWGGFGGAPKFPSTMSLDLIAQSLLHEPSELRSTMLTTSLDAMASGGIYDHIGGGFARYSVDEQWLVPHFEKMLYDQALFVRVYTHAAVATGLPRYRQVVEETVEYVLRDLRHLNGGFYCAEDADSPDEHGHGHEGLFHTWTIDEVRAVLGPDAHAALEWYDFVEDGNFEGRSIPTRMHHRGELARPAHIEAARQALFEARNTRLRPGLDDKVLTEWNGMMLASLCEAAAIFDRADWTAGRHRQWRIPPAQPAASRWSLAPLMARERRAPGASRCIGGRSRGADRCVHTIGRTDGRGAVDSSRTRGSRRHARSLLGCRSRWTVHDRRRRRAPGRPAERVVRQRDTIGQLNRRACAVSVGRADRRGALHAARRSDPATARPRHPTGTERVFASDHGRVVASRRDDRNRRHWRAAGSCGRSSTTLATKRRAGMGRALRQPVVGATRRWPGVCVP